ncbi:MAG: pyridoxamine 5'-phosphate oxidase [Acidovorax sp.]|nr:MAG: pyridoxamine 5'-phosphate oxidase [Acidovorax sp.]
MSHSPLSSSIADLRKSYERAELSEDASHADPLLQFDQWLREAIAAQVPEPNAMTVATVGSDLRPSTRVVLIKGYDAQGIVWYTNYDSRKGRQIAGNPYAALQFHWVELERVVRIEGVVEKVSEAESGAQFLLKPPRPPHWGGFRLRPDQWEFWQGRKSRLHDRLRYRLEDGTWERERLAP